MVTKAFWTAVVLNLVVLAWSAGELPEPVATHFGASNQADNWSSRTGYLVFALLLVLLTAGFLAGLAQWLRRSMPVSMISMPTKQRWIDAGQVPLLRSLMADDLYGIGALTLLLFAVMQVLTVEANRHQPAVLSNWSWVVIALYVVVLLAWTAWLTVVKYRRPPVGN